MTVSCGGTRRASLRATQVMCANTFFLHPCPLRQPDFAHPPPPPPSEIPEPPPPARLVGVPGQIRACRLGPKPHPSLLGKFRRSLRHTASATAPQRPLPTVIGACMYVHVCACIVCMCMYFSVCISSRYASQIFLEENLSLVFPPQVMTNQFSLVGQCMYVSVLHVCVCIACICLYCMNYDCIGFYCSGRHKNHRSVPK